MKTLLLYPQFPKTFWSYDKFMELANLKAVIPPLGIITVAALLPEDWEIRFYDRNVKEETDADWEWCDLIIVSGMIAQKDDFLAQITKAKQLGKKVAVGGPYPTSLPEESEQAGANYLILDEGEITIPQFLEALAQDKESGVFRALEKPDITLSPMPRFDLLDRDAYLKMAIQFSRGCPFQCEFCDITTLYGRKSRTKEPTQILAELQTLYDLGWRGAIFMVDDNFIGNKRNVKRLLRELIPWMQEHNYPFTFFTEASVDLAEDAELLELMVKSGFSEVFMGIETPDKESLKVTHKFQNIRSPLVEACRIINQAGLIIYAGFILGFDGEKAGAGARIQAFVEETSIPQPMLNVLQALPNTALWQRLIKEQRLGKGFSDVGLGDTNSLMNFVPTRPVAEIAKEYLEMIWTLYEPKNYLRRCFEQCIQVTANPSLQQSPHFPPRKAIQLVVRLLWRQGWQRREIRHQFWQQLWKILRTKPQLLNIYLGLCAAGEHFCDYRIFARERITQQLGFDPLS